MQENKQVWMILHDAINKVASGELAASLGDTDDVPKPLNNSNNNNTTARDASSDSKAMHNS